MEPKWCFHCRKDNHNDAECWSTRMCTCNSYPHTTECGTPAEEQLALIRRVINEHREVLTALKDR